MGQAKKIATPDSLCRFGVSLEEDLLEPFDRLTTRKGYATRSEALRDPVRQALVEETLADEAAEAVATVSLVYNHHVRNLTARLTQFQDGARDLIASTLHGHLDEQRCLEVLVVRGPYGRVRQRTKQLISLKGVVYSKFVTTLGSSEPPESKRRTVTRHHSHGEPASRRTHSG